MQRSNRENGALRQLKTEEAELQLRLAQVRKAIAALNGTHSEPRQSRPKCRAELLREHLLDRPEGVRARDVPTILKAMRAATIELMDFVYEAGNHGEHAAEVGEEVPISFAIAACAAAVELCHHLVGDLNGAKMAK